MYISKVGSVLALVCLFLSLTCLCQAQYNPNDWSGPSYEPTSGNVVFSGSGKVDLTADGSAVSCSTEQPGDYAYGTADCKVSFVYKSGNGRANFYGLATGYLLSHFGNNSYGYSSNTIGSLSDQGQADHNYSDSAYVGFSAVINSMQNTVSYNFTVTAGCHDSYGGTYARGEVDSHPD